MCFSPDIDQPPSDSFWDIVSDQSDQENRLIGNNINDNNINDNNVVRRLDFSSIESNEEEHLEISYSSDSDVSDSDVSDYDDSNDDREHSESLYSIVSGFEQVSEISTSHINAISSNMTVEGYQQIQQ